MKEKEDIEEIADLQEAIECDPESHRIKELAELFVNSMNDWPTYNQTKIADFVQELKTYYGNPLTIDSIDRKEHDPKDNLNLWRHEAGSSIAEMIDISKRFEGESNFDKILQKLLDYYKMVKYHRITKPKAH